METTDFDGKLGEKYSDSLAGFPHYFRIQDAFMGKILKLTRKKEDRLSILEAGCGSGITTVRLAFLRPDCTVLAVDNSRQMISQAQGNLQFITNRVDFLLEDIMQFNPKKEFDIFASGFMMHNFIKQKRAKMIRSAYNWLKDGGVFALMDIIAQNDDVLHQKDYEQQLEYLTAFAQSGRNDLYEEWLKHYQRDQKRKFTERELITLLKEVGFRNIEIHGRFCMDLIVTAQK